MNTSQVYILVSIIILAIIAILVFIVRKNKKEQRFTPLASFAFAFILAGIFFGEERLIGYGLIGIGVILAIIDIITKLKNK